MTILRQLTKDKFESHHAFLMRTINYYLDNQVTSIEDISAVLRKRYGYSSSQVSKAKKSLIKEIKIKIDILMDSKRKTHS